MKVRLRYPDREVELARGRTIHDVLGELEIDPDTVLVIRERELLMRGERVADEDVIEVRPARARVPGGRSVPGSGHRRVLVTVARSGAAFAHERETRLVEIGLVRDHVFDVPTAGRKGSRSTCAVCGLSKRYVFNRAAREGGYDVIATGHNLDDEAATLLGNTLRWQTDYIARQFPMLPAEEGLARKVKPLYRLSELETAAYAFLRGIDYVVEECPLVAGNTQLRYKEAMNRLESASPGTKAQFFLGYLDRAAPLFAAQDDATLTACLRCGEPTAGRVCAFCRARAQILEERLDERRASRAPSGAEPHRDLSNEVMPVEIYESAAR